MTAVSALSILRFHPRARIVILMDPATHQSLSGLHARLLEIAAPVVVDLGIDDPRYASRAIKLRARESVAGDLLFIDSDTVLVRPLPDDLPACRVAGVVYDRWDRRGRPALRLDSWVEQLFHTAGWEPASRYFNAGVVWMPDTPDVHRLCERWRERWEQTCRLGRHNDQPALNAAIGELPDAVRPLASSYNVSVGSHPELIRSAIIYHFWVEKWFDAARPITLLDHLILHYRRTGALDGAAVERARRRRFPWMRPVGIRMAWRAGAWRALPYTFWCSALARLGLANRRAGRTARDA